MTETSVRANQASTMASFQANRPKTGISYGDTVLSLPNRFPAMAASLRKRVPGPIQQATVIEPARQCLMVGREGPQTMTEPQFELEFEDQFTDNELDTTRWIPYSLPHWSSWERSAARYALGDGYLRLLIERDQEPWCPELDGPIRVSLLQTGLFAGPVGSPFGTLRFNPAAVV